MGNTSTEVVIAGEGKFWSRTIPLGGDHFTKAIGTELKLTMAKAEHLKQNGGMIGLGENPKVVLDCLDGTWKDLIKEVKRSVDYFKGNNRREIVINEGVLSGGGFLLPTSVNRLSEVFEMEFQRMDDLDGNDGRLVIAHGLALAGLGSGWSQTNLMKGKKKPFVWESFFRRLPRIKIVWPR